MTDISVIEQIRAALAAFEEEAADAIGGHQFLKYTKGEWSYGANETEVTPDIEMAVNMIAYAKGWICWADGKAVDEQMAPIASGRKIDRADLADHGPYESGDGWKAQHSIALKAIEEGVELKYSTSTQGGIKALKGLAAAYVAQVKSGSDDLIPIVSLSTDSYKHASFGKIHVPVITVLGWSSEGAIMSGDVDLGSSVDDTPPFELEQPEAAAPARKRRRRTSEALPQ